jgi:hypothetical protein
MNLWLKKTFGPLLALLLIVGVLSTYVFAETDNLPIKYHEGESEIVKAHTQELKDAQVDLIAQDLGEHIVFCLDDGIYVQFSNGTGRRRIVTRGAGFASFSYPTWSLDGTQIAWAAVRTDPRYVDLCLANSDGSNPRAIFNLSTGYYQSFIQSISWSWDNQYIMFNHAYNDWENNSYFIVCTISPNGTGFSYVNDFTRSYSQYEPITGSNRYAYISTGTFVDANSRVHVSNLNGSNDVTWFTFNGTIAGFTHICWNSPTSVYTVIRWWSQYPNREVLLRIDRINNQTFYNTIAFSDPSASLWCPTVSPDRRAIYNAELTASTSTLWLTTLDANGNVIENQAKGAGFFPNWRQRIPTGIDQDGNQPTPATLALAQNYPNPFNAKTTISYNLTEESNVALAIYDILGNKVASLASGNQPSGTHLVVWDASGFSSGIYFCELGIGDYREIRRMILIK